MSGGFVYFSAMKLECSNGIMKVEAFTAVGAFRCYGLGRHKVMGIRQMQLQFDASSSDSGDDSDDDGFPGFFGRAIQSSIPSRRAEPTPTQTSDLYLDAQVKSVKVYKRQLDKLCGSSSSCCGFDHKAAVAKTTSGERYVIEKGVSRESNIGKSKECYRKGECRLVKIEKSDIHDWELVRKLKAEFPNSSATLRHLLDRCGSAYSLLRDNCIDGVRKICNFLEQNNFINAS
uniref:SAWADEE domain-containing protein n=1 Tax=Macrostomum lignano TaxID=282301 RepID=A0A1I8HPC4_9PLAT